MQWRDDTTLPSRGLCLAYGGAPSTTDHLFGPWERRWLYVGPQGSHQGSQSYPRGTLGNKSTTLIDVRLAPTSGAKADIS